MESNQAGKSVAVCKVVAIDTYPPYRRPLLLDELPAPPGEVNLARFLWQRLDDDGYNEVRRQLHTVGFHISTTTPLDPRPALERVRADADPAPNNTPLCASLAAAELMAVTVDLGVMGKRIIGFDQAANAPSTAPAPMQPDEFTKIKGVGPAFAQALTDAGYTTYAAVAGLHEEELRHVLEQGTKIPIPIPADTLKGILASAQELALGSK